MPSAQGERRQVKILVNSKKLKVTAGMREFIAQQAERLGKLNKSVTEVHVYVESVVKRTTSESIATAVTYTIAIPGRVLIVKKKAGDVAEAVTEATDSALRLLRKTYERKLTLKRHRLVIG